MKDDGGQPEGQEGSEKEVEDIEQLYDMEHYDSDEEEQGV